MRIWSFLWLPSILSLIVSAQAQAPDRSAALRITVVGQSSIHSDLRNRAGGRRTGAQVPGERGRSLHDLEVAVASRDAVVEPRRNAERVDPQVLDCLREMGFNLLSLSNNHALDLGMAGLRTTREEVARRGFGFAGTGANLAGSSGSGLRRYAGGTDRADRYGFRCGSAANARYVGRAGPCGMNFLEQRKDGTLNPEQASRILESVRNAARQSSGVIVYQHNHYWGDGQGSGLPPGRSKTISRFETPQWQVA